MKMLARQNLRVNGGVGEGSVLFLDLGADGSPGLAFFEGVDDLDLLRAFRVDHEHGSGRVRSHFVHVVGTGRIDGRHVITVGAEAVLLVLVSPDDASDTVGCTVFLDSVMADSHSGSTRTDTEAFLQLIARVTPEQVYDKNLSLSLLDGSGFERPLKSLDLLDGAAVAVDAPMDAKDFLFRGGQDCCKRHVLEHFTESLKDAVRLLGVISQPLFALSGEAVYLSNRLGLVISSEHVEFGRGASLQREQGEQDLEALVPSVAVVSKEEVVSGLDVFCGHSEVVEEAAQALVVTMNVSKNLHRSANL